MQDSDTLTVYEKCKHGQLERHPLGWLSPELIEPEFEQVETDLMGGVLCWCPGGREIVLKAIEGFTFPPHDKTATIQLTDPNPKVWVEVEHG